MDRLEAMHLFVRVVESGSFSAVARESGLGQPAVSKQIAALESHLGAQLLLRTSRSMTLTDAGQTFYESAVRLLDDLSDAESLVGRGQSAPSGLVRITTAPVFGRLCIVPRLPEFFARYPDIAVELSASAQNVNLLEEGVDLAVRVGDLGDSTLVARKIAVAPFVTVATPAYLERYGTPVMPADLERHAAIIFLHHGEPRTWEFAGTAGPILHHPRGGFRTADAEQIRAAALAGLGVSHGPAYMFAPDIASGALQAVLPDHRPAPLLVSAVYPSSRRLPTKVRAVLDFLVDALREDPSLASD